MLQLEHCMPYTERKYLQTVLEKCFLKTIAHLRGVFNKFLDVKYTDTVDLNLAINYSILIR